MRTLRGHLSRHAFRLLDQQLNPITVLTVKCPHCEAIHQLELGLGVAFHKFVIILSLSHFQSPVDRQQAAAGTGKGARL